MSEQPLTPDVIHNPQARRFEVTIDGQMALLEYMQAGNNMIMTHTEVPPSLEGRGIGNQLARFALDYARDNGYKVQALCPFMAAYVKRHHEYQSITWGY